MTRWWRAETGFFLALWLLLMIGGRDRLFRDPGTFWHTVAGQKMLGDGQIIDSDWWTFTFPGERWVAHLWLGECAMAAVHQVAGLDSLLLFTATILAGLYTWAAHRLLRSGLHWSLVGVVLILTLGASTSHFHVRPHILSLVFFAWTYGWLIDFESGRIGVGRLFWLVPVYLLWTNIHGAMLGGLATMILAGAGWLGVRLLKLPTPLSDWRKTLAFAAVVAGCGLTMLVNPYGTDLPKTWLSLVGSDVLPRVIVEHAPLDPTKLEGMMVLLFALFWLAALIGIWPAWPRVTWLLPAVWFWQACAHIRHAPLFGLAAVLALADFWPQTRWARWLIQHRPDMCQPPISDSDVGPRERLMRFGGAMALPALVVLLTLGLQISGTPVPVLGSNWARLEPERWPGERLRKKLQAYERDHPGAPIFNDLNLGGYLVYYTPNLRIFVDDRCEFFGDQWIEMVDDANRSHPQRIEDWARQYGFDHALVQNGSGFDRYLSAAQGWEEMGRDPAAALYWKKPEKK